MDLTREAESFLKELENSNFTMATMIDRMPIEILYTISNYGSLINKISPKIDCDQADINTCCIIIGYLLRSHIKRKQLEAMING